MQSNPEGAWQRPAPALVEPVLAPLPLRARGVLEVLDAAIKVYRQYFWVLVAWSALVVAGSAVASLAGMFLPGGGALPSLFLSPLMTGAATCCIAAAVRGQTVDYRQCWQFTKPHYWTLVGLQVVSFIISMVVLFVVCLAGGLIALAGFLAFRTAPQNLQMLVWVTGFLVLGTCATVLATVVFVWQTTVPVVACMEHDKAGMQALGRAYQLLRGHWGRVTTLMTVLGLGMLALMAILGAAAVMLVGISRIRDLATGSPTDATVWATLVGFGLSYVLLWMIWNPIYYLITTLFYLDIRVRQEALDLEWAAHVTAPRATPLAVAAFSEATTLTAGTTATFPSSAIAAAPSPADGSAPAFSAYDQAPMPAQPPLEQYPQTTDGAPLAPAAVASRVAGTAPSAVSEQSPGAIACPRCGALSASTHLFCMHCGTRLKPQW